MRRTVLTAAATTAAVFAFTAGTASAAAPDGPGPWADSVVATDQGDRYDGSPVLATRSDPTAALGVAENTDVEGTFYALGFGGSLTLRFDNAICNAPGPDVGIRLVEVTREPYPQELVDVYVSEDGVDYVLAAEDVNKDSDVSLPDSINIARYVRVVDVSDREAFANEPRIADGYDVDGIRSLNSNCTGEGKMTGGGSTYDERKVTHGFVLHCDPDDKPNHLLVHWQQQKVTQTKKGTTTSWENQVFFLEDLESALCSDAPGIIPNPPVAPFDTYQGKGTGRLNGKDGATAEWTFTDSGEPGTDNDTVRIVIRDAMGNVVLNVGPAKFKGNHQAHAGHPAP